MEPNNGRTPFENDQKNADERHAVMNRLHGDRDGKWYDQPAEFKAHAICEKVASSFVQQAHDIEGHQSEVAPIRPYRMRGSRLRPSLASTINA